MSNIDIFDAPANGGDDLSKTVDGIQSRTNALGVSATQFANVMTKAFTDGVAGGKKFDDVLKSVGLRLSSLAVQQAFKPIAKDIAGGLSQLIGNLFSDASGRSGNDSENVTSNSLPSLFGGLTSAIPFA